jgi:hypothetical protein
MDGALELFGTASKINSTCINEIELIPVSKCRVTNENRHI